MRKLLIAGTMFVAACLPVPVSWANITDANVGTPLSRLIANGPHQSLFPQNVKCKDFDKTGYRVWQHRDRSTIDLGNWDAAFPITGAIEPGLFVSKGIDLFDVLEIKCGLNARAEPRSVGPGSSGAAR